MADKPRAFIILVVPALTILAFFIENAPFVIEASNPSEFKTSIKSLKVSPLSISTLYTLLESSLIVIRPGFTPKVESSVFSSA